MRKITVLPVAWSLLEKALRERRPVEVSYHGRQRLICPHALGWSNGRPLVLGYQSGGETSTGALAGDPRQRWRCMFVDDIERVAPAEPASRWQSADNYNCSHPFPAADDVAIAVTPDGCVTPLR
jgi:hypothetical protein